MLHVHPTAYRYDGPASPTTPGGMAIIYKDLGRQRRAHPPGHRRRHGSSRRGQELPRPHQLDRPPGPATWTGHLEKIAGALRELGHDPVILRGGMGAKTRAGAIARLTRRPDGPPRTQRLTTQEAADFLGVSRPTLVKILEDGKIPYDQPGRHRRLLFTDLLAYQQQQHASRRAALDQMTEDVSEAGIYGGTPEDYAAALKAARRRVTRPEGAS